MREKESAPSQHMMLLLTLLSTSLNLFFLRHRDTFHSLSLRHHGTFDFALSQA